MRCIKRCVVLVLGMLSAIYLANIGAGVVELVPDNIPVAGNLDEAVATLLLMHCLAYLGFDLRRKPPAAPKPDEWTDG